MRLGSTGHGRSRAEKHLNLSRAVSSLAQGRRFQTNRVRGKRPWRIVASWALGSMTRHRRLACATMLALCSGVNPGVCDRTSWPRRCSPTAKIFVPSRLGTGDQKSMGPSVSRTGCSKALRKRPLIAERPKLDGPALGGLKHVVLAVRHPASATPLHAKQLPKTPIGTASRSVKIMHKCFHRDTVGAFLSNDERSEGHSSLDAFLAPSPPKRTWESAANGG